MYTYFLLDIWSVDGRHKKFNMSVYVDSLTCLNSVIGLLSKYLPPFLYVGRD